MFRMGKVYIFSFIMIILFTLMPQSYVRVSAAEDLSVIFKDITDTDTSTIAGEAKLLVSVDGAAEDVSIAQLAFSFQGELKFKSIQYLIGEDNPENGSVIVSPNAAAANRDKQFTTGIISTKTAIDMSREDTKLFILTFSGEPGEQAEITLRNDSGQSYFRDMKGNEIVPAAAGGTITASKTGVKSADADVRFKIFSEDSGDYPDANAGYKTGIYVTVKDTIANIAYTTELNYTPVSKGGTLEDIGDEITFLVSNKVIADNLFDVTIWGEGFNTYEKKGISFSDGNGLVITSDDFYPAVTAKVSQNGRTASFYVSNKEQRQLKGYIAAYENGRLTEVKSKELSKGSTVLRVSSYPEAEYKAFIWDLGMEPN